MNVGETCDAAANPLTLPERCAALNLIESGACADLPPLRLVECGSPSFPIKLAHVPRRGARKPPFSMPSQKFFSPLYEMVERCDLRTARFSDHWLSLSLSVLIRELPLFFTLTQPFKVGIHQGYRVRCHVEEYANDKPWFLSQRGLDRD